MTEKRGPYGSNREVYATVELATWAHRRALIPAEQFLFECYLRKNGETLEGGTGGGRLLLALQALGFTSLAGFDLVSELVEYARRADPTHSIRFEVGDAAALPYEDSSFDQLVYLQQVICFIENASSRLAALREAHRILRAGGTALFSFLSFEARRGSATYWPLLAHLQVLRTLRRSPRTIQSLPWLRLAGNFNPRSLLDAGPYVYWYRLDEICRLLTKVGFQIAAVGSTRQIAQGRMCDCRESLEHEPIEGMLYIVGRK